MGIKQELGQKIKRMRISRGLTQEGLAELVDVSQRTLSGIEIGENFITADTLDRIIKALNTTAEELFATNHLKSSEEACNITVISNKKEGIFPLMLESYLYFLLLFSFFRKYIQAFC